MSASKYKSFSDPELVAMCLKGDAQAWETIIMRYRRLIFSVPVRFGFSSADASDVFQQVCLKLIEHLNQLKDDTKVSAWLVTTTTRQCIHLKAMKHRETTSEEDMEEPPDPGESLETLRITTEQQQAVRDAVDELPERCRNLLQMLYLDTRTSTYEEVSEAMGMPIASIGPTRARCLDKLKTVLRRRGIK